MPLRAAAGEGADYIGCGAGIQADIKTIAAHKMYGVSVITALTAQNAQGVFAIKEISPAFVRKQIDCVFKDIVHDAVKIGMVASGETIEAIAEKLKEYDARNIVLDPVMISTS
jgi:hydroxymethylpyrimidine kinase/phosphomethylpyrimidine kinase